ncbi:MAG TPA: hypothetical protein VIM31_02600 [Candidatus Microsaccharimonas sp.]|jgi:hypothetical protein
MTAEQQPQNPENAIETPTVSAEHYEKADKNIEAQSEQIESGEKAAEKARTEALETAISVERGSAEKKTRGSDAPTPRRRGGISKKEKTASYKKHMKQVQAELPPAQRAFSKVIHAPIVEKTSEFVGATVARPNAILSGAIVAFILVLAVYVVAKNLGYVLSGFETIGAFIIGWVIGILYDYFKVLVTGKK